MKTLFVAWQDPERRTWYPVARLVSSNGNYEFSYTRGAEQAQEEAGFEPLTSFPDLRNAYVSEDLFPLFSNRLLPQSRPEYSEYLAWLSVPPDEHDPVVILARSGGRRVTDNLEVFPCPEQEEHGLFQVHFLLHGLSHMTDEAAKRTADLKSGEPLLPMCDFRNPKDPDAIALRTAETFPKDMYLIGYCPRYLKGDFRKLLKDGGALDIQVVRVNPPPAPVQFRVLCRAVMKWPPGFTPFSGPEYESIANGAMSVACPVIAQRQSNPDRELPAPLG